MAQMVNKSVRTIFLSCGGLLGDSVLHSLLQNKTLEVVGVVRSRRVMLKNAGFLRGAIAFFARCGVVYTVYIWLITTFAEFLGLFTGTGSITARARRSGIPVCHTKNVNGPEGLAFIEGLSAGLLVVAHFDQRLDAPLCSGPSRRCVNIHPSILPHYRGIDPVFQTMRKRDTHFGVSIHAVSPEIDAGPVLHQVGLSPSPASSVLGLTLDLVQVGVQLLASVDLNALPALLEATVAEDSYHSWPTGRQTLELYQAGGKLISLQDARLFWRKWECPFILPREHINTAASCDVPRPRGNTRREVPSLHHAPHV